ncbi:MAG: hypothetical protein ACK5UX_04875 [Burkholderiales bacterium]
MVGYISYLAACRNATVYSEYLLYEPLLRIAHAQGFLAKCEVAVRESRQGRGDKKRIDFVLSRGEEHLAIEVKWTKTSKPDIKKDVAKLGIFRDTNDACGYVLVFGRLEHLQELKPKDDTKPMSRGKLVTWNAGRTSYAAQWIRYF